MVIFLVGCSDKKEDPLQMKENVLEALAKHNISWVEDNEGQYSGGLFSLPLNKVTPTTLTQDDSVITFYTYKSSAERRKAVKMFLDGSKTMDLVPHRMYEKGNVLVFYVYYAEPFYNEDINVAIEKAIKSL